MARIGGDSVRPMWLSLGDLNNGANARLSRLNANNALSNAIMRKRRISMIVTAHYTTEPDDVHVMPREKDGVADIRMTKDYVAGSGEGEEAILGHAQEAYFAIPLSDAPTAEAIRANWDGWWAYGAEYTDGMFGIDMDAFMRGKRDKLLQESDYLVSLDYPLPDEVRKEVMTYRQALRDITA